MSTQYTSPYNLPYPQSGDKVADGYAAIEGIAKAVNTALVNGSFPASSPDVASITARLNALEGGKAKAATLSSGVSLQTAGKNAMATRDGIIVNFNGRFNRTTATTNVCTLPTGYRPTEQCFWPVIINSSTTILLQVDPNGLISTPFSTVTGDLMVNVTFSVPLTPAAS